jgi:hypothetical protein
LEVIVRSSLFRLAVGAGLLVATGVPIRAHHSFASEYDAKQTVNLKGTVTKMEWINPHAWIHLAVKSPDGKVENWMVEGAAPNALLRRGFNKNSLPPGTEIVVSGFRSKDGANRVNGNNVTMADGKTLFLGSSGTGAPYDPEKK